MSDKSYNRLATSHVGSTSDDFKLERSIISSGRGFTSPMRTGKKPSERFTDIQPWLNSAVSDVWPALETRALSSLVHMNKKSIMKTSCLEDYPIRPKYVDAKEISTRGLIGEGYQVSRPVKIEANRYELLNLDREIKEIEASVRHEDKKQLMHQNSKSMWMDEYSEMGKKRKEEETKEKNEREHSFRGEITQVRFSSPEIEAIDKMDAKLEQLARQEELKEKIFSKSKGSFASAKKLASMGS